MEIGQNKAWNERDLIAHHKKATALIDSANEDDWSINGNELARRHYWLAVYENPGKRPRPSLARHMQHLWGAPLEEIRLAAIQRHLQKPRLATAGDPETAEREMRAFGRAVQELSSADDREHLKDELECLVLHAETATVRRLAHDAFVQLCGNRVEEGRTKQ